MISGGKSRQMTLPSQRRVDMQERNDIPSIERNCETRKVIRRRPESFLENQRRKACKIIPHFERPKLFIYFLGSLSPSLSSTVNCSGNCSWCAKEKTRHSREPQEKLPHLRESMCLLNCRYRCSVHTRIFACFPVFVRFPARETNAKFLQNDKSDDHVTFSITFPSEKSLHSHTHNKVILTSLLQMLSFKIPTLISVSPILSETSNHTHSWLPEFTWKLPITSTASCHSEVTSYCLSLGCQTFWEYGVSLDR